MNTRKDLLNLLTVRTETIKLDCLKNTNLKDMELDCLKNTNLKDMEFQLKEMNIAQTKGYHEIQKSGEEDSYDKCMKYACNEVMVDPLFFTDEEFENLNGFGSSIMFEIFTKIPTIGMTVKEKKDYDKKVIELAKKQIEKKATDEVDEEKK